MATAYYQLIGNNSRLQVQRTLRGDGGVSVHFHSTLQFFEVDPRNTTSRPVAASPAHSHDRPATAWERLRYFPSNLFKLWQDYLRYQNILDASKTKQNAWTMQRHVLVQMNFDIEQQQQKQLHLSSSNDKLTVQNGSQVARIPRRQYQQMLQFQRDFHIVLPMLLLTAPPIIGYLPLVLAIVAPRQVLSRQFHNEHEISTIRQQEYQQRQEQYHEMANSNLGKALGDALRGNLSAIMQHRNDDLREDAAGPILNLSAVETAMFSNRVKHDSVASKASGSYLVSHLPQMHDFTSWNHVPRAYLEQLALASGVFQMYPTWIGKVFISGYSRNWLQRQLKDIANSTFLDDIMLLEEGYDQSGCQSLTDMEVADACLVRGLPVCIAVDEMRECLTHHLQMIKEWTVSRPRTTNKEATELFLLHIAPIRSVLRHNLINRAPPRDPHNSLF
jgi:hypothetical protein